MARFATTSVLGFAAVALSTVTASAEALTFEGVRSSIAQGLLPLVSAPARTLEARSLYKRYEVCGTSGSFTYYCERGSCIGLTRCTRPFNYAWIAAIVAAIFLCSLLGWCVRRRNMSRAHAAASTEPVVTTVVTPGVADPNQPYGAYVTPQPQPGMWAPPKEDPNLAYQTPASYPPPGATPAPTYSAYPPASGAPAYPVPAAGSPYAQPAPPAGYPSPVPPTTYAQPAPYPVPQPQGEASSYVPPKV